jgi:hypothetical protein
MYSSAWGARHNARHRDGRRAPHRPRSTARGPGRAGRWPDSSLSIYPGADLGVIWLPEHSATLDPEILKFEDDGLEGGFGGHGG